MNSPDASLTTGSFSSLGYTHSEGFNLQNNLTFTESQSLLNEYGLHLASCGLSPSTSRYYLSDARQFIEWVGDLPIVPSTMGDKIAASYSGYLLQPVHQLRPNSRGRYSPGSIRRKLHSLRHFFDHLIGECILIKNPFRAFNTQIPQHAFSTREHKILSVDTIRRLISTCDISTPKGIRDKSLLALIAALGMRVGEIHQLDFADIDYRERSLCIMKQCSGIQVLPLPDPLCDTLKRWVSIRSIHSACQDALFVSLHHNSSRGAPGLRLSRRGIRSIVDTRLLAIGVSVSGGGPSLLRRSAAHHSIVTGVDLEGVQYLFGITPKAFRAHKQYTSALLRFDDKGND